MQCHVGHMHVLVYTMQSSSEGKQKWEAWLTAWYLLWATRGIAASSFAESSFQLRATNWSFPLLRVPSLPGLASFSCCSTRDCLSSFCTSTGMVRCFSSEWILEGAWPWTAVRSGTPPSAYKGKNGNLPSEQQSRFRSIYVAILQS